MNVKQLIEELSKLDPNLVVSVSGYEGGVTDFFYLGISLIAKDVNKSKYYGEHEALEDEYDMRYYYEDAQKDRRLIIFRGKEL